MSLRNTKIQLRRELLHERQSLSSLLWVEKSLQICQILEAFPLFQKAKTVLAYFSFRQEPTLDSLFQNNKKWGFSRCVGQSLVWHTWHLGDPLETGIYGISEPQRNAPTIGPSEIDLILVPSVACDAQGYRLGYGGGYYDRLLSASEWYSIPTIGIVFDFAYLPSLPVEPWDRPLTAICTELDLILTKA